MKKYEKITLRPEVVYQLNDDGMMIYVSEEGMIHAINLTAADIILFIEQGVNSLESLIMKMLDKYVGVSREELLNDIQELLNSMEELGIIAGE